MGLYVRCRKHTKSFYLRRLVGGKLVKETFGEMPVKKTREEAMKTWSALKPKAAAHDVVTLDIAIERYLEEKPLAEKTKSNYKYNRAQYLRDSKDRSLHDVGNDRAGFQFLMCDPHGQTLATLVFPASCSTTCDALLLGIW